MPPSPTRPTHLIASAPTIIHDCRSSHCQPPRQAWNHATTHPVDKAERAAAITALGYRVPAEYLPSLLRLFLFLLTQALFKTPCLAHPPVAPILCCAASDCCTLHTGPSSLPIYPDGGVWCFLPLIESGVLEGATCRKPKKAGNQETRSSLPSSETFTSSPPCLLPRIVF